MTELNSAEQIAAIKRDEIDVGFVLGERAATGVNGFRLHSEPLVACITLRHPLAKAKKFKLDWLKEDEFVSLSPNRSTTPTTSCRLRATSVREKSWFSRSVATLAAKEQRGL